MQQSGTIGIIGGGQLGRMLTLAAISLGFRVIVIDPVENCPAAQVGAKQIKADLYDSSALKQLGEQTNFITIEIEHFDTTLLDQIVAAGTPVNPSPDTIRLIQDKLVQKQALRSAGIPLADFVELPDEASAQQALKDYGGKMLVKTRRGGFDGRGNILVNNADELQKVFKEFGGQELYAEQIIPFVKELSVVVACADDGATATYPVVETVHERNICTEVLAPAQIEPALAEKARQVALSVANFLRGAGVFAIEMFLSSDGQILVNEIAPRVHNSGHYTIEACRTSQFEQHIRAVTGLPLGSTDMLVPAACMVNVLGTRDGTVALSGLDGALAEAHTSVHIYGKSPTKVDRKMGHITATADNLDQAQDRAWNARRKLSI